MPQYQAQFQLIINNETFIFWDTIKITRELNAISTIDITVPNRFGKFTNSWSKDMTIEFLASFGGSALSFWKGNIDSITRAADRHGTIQIWGRDPGRILQKEKTVDDEFNPYPNMTATYLDILQYVNLQLSSPLSWNAQVSPVDFQITKEFGYDDSLQLFEEAITFAGYEWFFSGQQDAIVIRPPRDLVDENIVKTFILGDPNNYAGLDLSTMAFLLSDKVETDYSDTYNRIKCEGLNGVSGVFPSSQVSEPSEFYAQNDEWTTASAALTAAENLYNDRKLGRTSIDIKILHGHEGMEVGDVIKCDDGEYGLSQLPINLFKIIKITDSFDKSGWNSQYELGDFKPTLSDFL